MPIEDALLLEAVAKHGGYEVVEEAAAWPAIAKALGQRKVDAIEMKKRCAVAVHGHVRLELWRGELKSRMRPRPCQRARPANEPPSPARARPTVTATHARCLRHRVALTAAPRNARYEDMLFDTAAQEEQDEENEMLERTVGRDYEVDSILDDRIERGDKQYLIKWKDCEAFEDQTT